MNKKTFFIGGDYNSNGLSWWLPIFFEYCKHKKIERIIFETKNISKMLLSNPYFIEEFKKFEIIYLDEILPWWAKNKITKLFFSPFQSIVFFILSFFNYHQFTNQFLKLNIIAITDAAAREARSHFLTRSNYHVLKYSLFSGYYIWLGNFLSLNTYSCVVLHNTYRYRHMVLVLKNKKIPTFHISKFTIYRQNYGYTDFQVKVLDVKSFNKLRLLLKKNEYKKYWLQRISGNSSYKEANMANSFGKNKSGESSIDLKSNYIFLHVFKDSPYSWFKSYKNQLFKDYIQWFVETIKILKFSNEKWYIKPHPASGIYLDDLTKLKNEINILIKDYKNIEFLDKQIPNSLIFKNCEKLVTFSGTSSIEFAAFGKKPIIVYPNVLTETIKDAAFLPKTYQEYSNLLLNKLDNRLSQKKIRKVKEFLYIWEHIITSEKDLNALHIYTSTKSSKINKDIKTLLTKIPENLEYYKLYGKLLADSKLKTGVSKPYIKKYIKL